VYREKESTCDNDWLNGVYVCLTASLTHPILLRLVNNKVEAVKRIIR